MQAHVWREWEPTRLQFLWTFWRSSLCCYAFIICNLLNRTIRYFSFSFACGIENLVTIYYNPEKCLVLISLSSSLVIYHANVIIWPSTVYVLFSCLIYLCRCQSFGNVVQTRARHWVKWTRSLRESSSVSEEEDCRRREKEGRDTINFNRDWQFTMCNRMELNRVSWLVTAYLFYECKLAWCGYNISFHSI